MNKLLLAIFKFCTTKNLMLTVFVLQTEKHLVVVNIFQISQQPQQIRKSRRHQKILLMQGIFLKCYF